MRRADELAEKRIEQAVAVAEELEREGFHTEVLLCGDMPCLHAYKKPTLESLQKEKPK